MLEALIELRFEISFEASSELPFSGLVSASPSSSGHFSVCRRFDPKRRGISVDVDLWVRSE